MLSSRATANLTLTEYQPSTGILLSQRDVDSLRSAIPTLTVEPSIGQPGHYDITPSSWIGTVALSDLEVVIRPKLPIHRVLFLMSYAAAPKAWRQTGFRFDEEDLVVEAIIHGFVYQLRQAFRLGTLQGYRTLEDSENTIRGRLRFEDQIRRRYGIFPPAEVRYDEYTVDIPANQLIKAAIERLRRLRIRSPKTRELLHGFDSLLANVTPIEFDSASLPEIAFDRLNEHYRPAVHLARLILMGASFELRHGRVAASSFLIDMNGSSKAL